MGITRSHHEHLRHEHLRHIREHGHRGAVRPASDRIVSTNLVRAAAGTSPLVGIATEGNRAEMSRTGRARGTPNTDGFAIGWPLACRRPDFPVMRGGGREESMLWGRAERRRGGREWSAAVARGFPPVPVHDFFHGSAFWAAPSGLVRDSPGAAVPWSARHQAARAIPGARLRARRTASSSSSRRRRPGQRGSAAAPSRRWRHQPRIAGTGPIAQRREDPHRRLLDVLRQVLGPSRSVRRGSGSSVACAFTRRFSPVLVALTL